MLWSLWIILTRTNKPAACVWGLYEKCKKWENCWCCGM